MKMAKAERVDMGQWRGSSSRRWALVISGDREDMDIARGKACDELGKDILFGGSRGFRVVDIAGDNDGVGMFCNSELCEVSKAISLIREACIDSKGRIEAAESAISDMKIGGM